MQFEEERPRRYRHRRHRRSSSTSGEKLWMCCEYMCVHDHRVVVVCAPTIVSLLFVLRPSCRRDVLFQKCLCRYPVRPLRLPERRLTSVPANSGTPYVLFLAKVMPNFFVKFGMTLLKKRDIWGIATNAWAGVS